MDDRENIKMVIIGDSNVGKTSLAMRYAYNDFCKEEPPTIMGAYFEAQRQYNDTNVKFVIWDTAGSERFQSITPLYYRGAAAAIIVYDITSDDSFHHVTRWYDQLIRNSSVRVVIACGNKCDREDERRVTVDQGSVMASNLGISFHETSALTGENVDNIFDDIVMTLFEKDCGIIRNSWRETSNNFDSSLSDSTKTEEKKGKRRKLRCTLG